MTVNWKVDEKDALALGHIQVTGWPRFAILPGMATWITRVVGYAWAYKEKDEPIKWDSELNSMQILPEYKRQGIARRLFAASAVQRKAQACKSICLWVPQDNSASRRFYEAIGGELSGTHQVELGDRELAVVAYGWKDTNQLEMPE